MQRHRHLKSRPNLLERLESRQFLSAAQIDFANFASTTGLVANGFGGAAITTNNALELTDGDLAEARSVLDSTKVPIATFTSHFSFQIAQGVQSGADGTQEADGFTFVIDNGNPTDLGNGGSDLGYSAGTFGSQSVAIGFNLYNDGSFGSTVGFALGGNATTDATSPPLDFHSGDIFNSTVTYDGSTLAITITDATTQQSANFSTAINLPQSLGAQTAYVGFTGGTGSDDSIQTIKSFDFTGTGVPPTVTVAASSSPSVITGTKAHLSVSAVSNESGTLSYAWSTLHVPPGAPAPTFKADTTSSANLSTAHFFKAGTYVLRVTVTDSNGGSTVSDLLLVVEQTPTQIKIEPHKAEIVKGHTEQYTGTVDDQFGHPLETQPGITYAVTTGSGTIGASSGLYDASGAVGHLVITVDADELSGIVGGVVIP